jgi:hypothetical protein
MMGILGRRAVDHRRQSNEGRLPKHTSSFKPSKATDRNQEH